MSKEEEEKAINLTEYSLNVSSQARLLLIYSNLTEWLHIIDT